MATISESDVLAALIASAGEPEAQVRAEELLDTTFEELGYDSLALIESVSRLEKRFAVTIPDDLVMDCRTFRELVERANG
ncbi:acyl carrier protein [Nocardia terpenica]|uniref:Actinorhodin polyketide synthase n=1 Tax=Nocardia terpenica TaxID=455432 RepID=A0A6G9YYU8_9NOCA|nr:acyl carrier protein [Nocardia terpenica]QIS18297.1 actinorhodin polyketide synthase [Nocardia terpenica]